MGDAGRELSSVEDAVAEAHRREWAKVLAAVVRTACDLDLAEEATQEAYVAALETWGHDGVPANPGAWLTTTARRKALDRLRREQTLRRKLPLLIVPDEDTPAPYDTSTGLYDTPTVTYDTSEERSRKPAGQSGTSGGLSEGSAETPGSAAGPYEAPAGGSRVPGASAGASGASPGTSGVSADGRLRLIFTCCHPALSMEARVALTLRMVCGLSTAEIARLFLIGESAMAARLTRAKTKIRAAGIAYRVPSENELPGRLPAVLAVLYLLFTAGYTATHGPELMRPELASGGIELTRLVSGTAPADPEVQGLLGLCLLTHARRAARVDEAGRLIPLADQDRRRWDRAMLDEGLELVERSLRGSRGAPGPYALQAAIAAVHAEAESYENTDWQQVLVLHDWLIAVHPSPVAALGRAVAYSMVHGPEAGLAEIAELATDPRLATYHLLPAVRADLLRRLGRVDQAVAEYETAVRLTDNDAERDFLRRRTLGMMKT